LKKLYMQTEKRKKKMLQAINQMQVSHWHLHDHCLWNWVMHGDWVIMNTYLYQWNAHQSLIMVTIQKSM
jgi:hypothetical protein